ncbi:MAG: archaellin/type IV pilin N-terminal domain-containing protein [Anaerolineae bacterium]
MNRFFAFRREERGVTALETAIILIAFVVIAAVFAFTVLSAGTFTTERSKEAIYSGVSQVRGAMELRGSVIATGNVTDSVVTDLTFTLANVAGGEAVDLSTGVDAKLVFEYRDATQRVVLTGTDWGVEFKGETDGDALLEERELAEITVTLPAGINPKPGVNTSFTIEIKPPTGAVLSMQRTVPANIDAIMDLN